MLFSRTVPERLRSLPSSAPTPCSPSRSMFRYLFESQWVPAMCCSLAAHSIAAEWPSGEAPTVPLGASFVRILVLCSRGNRNRAGSRESKHVIAFSARPLRWPRGPVKGCQKAEPRNRRLPLPDEEVRVPVKTCRTL